MNKSRKNGFLMVCNGILSGFFAGSACMLIALSFIFGFSLATFISFAVMIMASVVLASKTDYIFNKLFPEEKK